ncbi:MAG: sensor signal transduction histidine kinase [Dehalococcoidia bacterium]|nr:sensor signal transduction histidine kinase [Dehalococcoidia bacterium]
MIEMGENRRSSRLKARLRQAQVSPANGDASRQDMRDSITERRVQHERKTTKLSSLRAYVPGPVVGVCAGAFLLAAALIALSGTLDIADKVGAALTVSSNWMDAALDAFLVLMVGAFATRVVSKLVIERIKMAEALRESEELFKTLANGSPVGIYIVQYGKFRYANPVFVSLVGRTEDEVLGTDPLEIVAAEDRKTVKERAAKMLEGELSSPYEFRVRHKDGGQKWLMESVSSIKYQGRRATLGCYMDITEHRQAEDALKLQEAYYQQLFDNSPDAIVTLDSGDRVVDINKGFETLFGYSKEEIRGRFVRELVVPANRFDEVSSVHQALLGTGSVRNETVRIRKDGSPVDVSVVGYRITSGDKSVGTCVIYSDISHRKKMEEEIRRAAKEWRTTFDSITDSVAILDGDFRLARVNKAFADTVSKSPKEVIGSACYRVIQGRDEPCPACYHREVVRTGRPCTAEVSIPDAGVSIEVTASPVFDGTGQVVGSVRVARDVTGRKQMQEQLMLSDRLASIGELAAGIAHELNNPLTSVIGFSQLVMERDIADDIRDDLTLVYSEAQRAAGIVKNLLTFARKHAPVKQPTQIENVIEDVLRLRAYEQKVSNIEVCKRFASELPKIMVDYFQMQQVFLNIIINGEYFMTQAHKKGVLTVATERLGDMVRISFADDGLGIPKENLTRIFNPFFTTKEVGKGTGLGLSICHGIINEHGGRIYTRSRPGEGATFVIELPVSCQ